MANACHHLSLTDAECRALDQLASKPDVAPRVAVEARALRMAADGMSNAEIARRCRVSPETVRRWRRSFLVTGVDGVGAIAPGRGRKSSVTPDLVESVMQLTLYGLPPNGRRWSTRTVARRLQISKDTVAKIWRQERFRPLTVVPGAGEPGATANGGSSRILDPQEGLASP